MISMKTGVKPVLAVKQVAGVKTIAGPKKQGKLAQLAMKTRIGH